MAKNEIVTKAERQMERVADAFRCIRDDVESGEYDGARAHIEILRRRLTDLDEKLFAAATMQPA